MHKGMLTLSFLCTTNIALAETNFDRDYCRNHANETEMAECVKRGIYDPCDDASGSRGWWSAQCAWAHARVAEERIELAKTTLAGMLRDEGGQNSPLYKRFLDSQKQWELFRESYCKFTNAADDSKHFEGSFLHYGYCWRRLNEQRAEELEGVLREAEEESAE